MKEIESSQNNLASPAELKFYPISAVVISLPKPKLYLSNAAVVELKSSLLHKEDLSGYAACRH